MHDDQKSNESNNSNNITWHSHRISRRERWNLNGSSSSSYSPSSDDKVDSSPTLTIATPCTYHDGCVLWFTGLSGSGKSTIANEIDYMLHTMYKARSYVLDGDNVRHGLNSNLSFTPSDRKENIRRISEVSKLMADSGLIVLVSFISPYIEDRVNARNCITTSDSSGAGGDNNNTNNDDDDDNIKFIEIYVNTSLNECEKRDPKGLYKKVRNGEIKNFTGIDSTYEPPTKPEIILDHTTTKTITTSTFGKSSSPKELAKQVIDYLIQNKIMTI